MILHRFVPRINPSIHSPTIAWSPINPIINLPISSNMRRVCAILLSAVLLCAVFLFSRRDGAVKAKDSLQFFNIGEGRF